jgi:hypothetical protein
MKDYLLKSGRKLSYKGIEIYKTPRIVWKILNPSKLNAIAYMGKIYVSPNIFRDLHSDEPDPVSFGILEHEVFHLETKLSEGKIKHLFKKLFLRKYRLIDELKADLAMMKVLKKARCHFPVDKRGRRLSSHLYFWMISEQKAKQILEEMWQTLELPEI